MVCGARLRMHTEEVVALDRSELPMRSLSREKFHSRTVDASYQAVRVEGSLIFITRG